MRSMDMDSRANLHGAAPSLGDLVRVSLDSLEQGITVFDAQLRLVCANRKFMELRDLPAHLGEEGTHFEDQIRFRAERGDYGAGDVDQLVQEHLELAWKFESHRIERTRRDGTVLEIRGDPLPGGGFIATYTDITKRKHDEEALLAAYAELELSRLSFDDQAKKLATMVDELHLAKAELEQSSSAKTKFLAHMSHELRTPLNAIIGSSEMIEEEILGPVGTEAYKEYAGDIRSSGRHLLDLINDLLDMSKIESGVDELHEQETPLHDIIESVIPMVRRRAETAEQTIEYELAESLPTVRADRRKLKQVLLNLLSNGLKFTPDGGKVTIKAWSNQEDGAVLQVIDTGVGIALEDIPKALSAFQQVSNDIEREQEGTGLGLPLTKALVEQHGGSLDLQSEVGTGTTVTVRLPKERVVSASGDAD